MKKRRLLDALHDRYFSTAGLIRKLTIEEAESLFAVRLADHGSDPVPFGFVNAEWNKLLQKIRPGDEIWEFSSVRPRGDTIGGVKLLRNAAVVDTIVAQRSSN
jgi:hypothetical protein